MRPLKPPIDGLKKRLVGASAINEALVARRSSRVIPAGVAQRKAPGSSASSSESEEEDEESESEEEEASPGWLVREALEACRCNSVENGLTGPFATGGVTVPCVGTGCRKKGGGCAVADPTEAVDI